MAWNNRAYSTDNLSIGHISIRKQGKNTEIFYIVWFRLIYLSVFGTKTYSSDKASIDISDMF